VKTREQISFNMSRVRRSGSLIERTLGQAMWSAGVRYRKQYHRLPGCPDFVVVRSKLAIFCDSSFWHGRNWRRASCQIKTNRQFWIPKIEGNMRRDKSVNRQLKALGWTVLRFWDDEILRDTGQCVDRVLDRLPGDDARGKHDTRRSR
jgi:DNA mismatch endonuclease, patch repair protein